jgi:hypothetical protein
MRKIMMIRVDDNNTSAFWSLESGVAAAVAVFC